ncbi:MAG TPA: HAD hydrolase-like protein [Vicinamibacterales bacterium]
MSRGTQQRWVTFDCFGTLVDWQTGFASMIAPLAGDRTSDVVRAYHASERIVERETPHRPYKTVLATALARAAAARGVSLSETDARALERSWGSLPIFDDAESMLAELRRHGWRLAVLTNCDDDLFEITHRRFRRPFDLFVTAERVRAYKPAPWHFRAFQRLTRVNRCEWVHVACSWYHDIAPAHEHGVQTVWLDRERTGEDASYASARVFRASEVSAAVESIFDGCYV